MLELLDIQRQDSLLLIDARNAICSGHTRDTTFCNLFRMPHSEPSARFTHHTVLDLSSASLRDLA
ncbi:hypothetical protein AN477_20905 [Alicyclobacillus ferrooxydans]|uniref:Uncharacterized protein n=1 Tax=Alicyclobacillus ferrooxydans TaxID=471514 RepID=A0A0P9GKY3_9BACL|nr:hypothetical protein AN477_20905 [Alicyclobacillus ferrooxydans]